MCTYADGENSFGYLCSGVYCFYCFGLFRCIKLENPNETSGGVSCFADNFLGHNLRPCGITKSMGFLTSGHL